MINMSKWIFVACLVGAAALGAGASKGVELAMKKPARKPKDKKEAENS